MNQSIRCLVLLALFGASTPLLAQPERGAALSRLDTDQDQRLSRDEAALAPRLAQQFPLIDANQDGLLERTELQAYAAARRELREEARRARFGALDADGNGVIAGDELEGRQRLARLDANADGRIELDEFKARGGQRSRRCSP